MRRWAAPARPTTAGTASHRPPARAAHERKPQPWALSGPERAEVLLDEGGCLCSVSAMYRLLRAAHGQVRERRGQTVHPPQAEPELVAREPNQEWSWDITRLTGPAKRTYYYLYSIIDISSRYTVGWMVTRRQSRELAERLLAETIAKQDLDRDQLTIHADRGSSLASKPVAFLLADLGVTKSRSRPHCSNDTPFSEAQFKTLKDRPDFPDKFGSIEDARGLCAVLHRWYNHEHRHSGIRMHTPSDVHHGHAGTVRAARTATLATAYATTPEMFVREHPELPRLPGTARINRPEADSLTRPTT